MWESEETICSFTKEEMSYIAVLMMEIEAQRPVEGKGITAMRPRVLNSIVSKLGLSDTFCFGKYSHREQDTRDRRGVFGVTPKEADND